MFEMIGQWLIPHGTDTMPVHKVYPESWWASKRLAEGFAAMFESFLYLGRAFAEAGQSFANAAVVFDGLDELISTGDKDAI